MPHKDPDKRRAYEKARNQNPIRRQANRERIARWKKENPIIISEARKRYMLKWRYGLTPEQYREMFEQQRGVCANIYCERPAEYIDHNHRTNMVRGLLCKQCNFAIGLLNDNVSVTQGIVDYLKRYSDGN